MFLRSLSIKKEVNICYWLSNEQFAWKIPERKSFKGLNWLVLEFSSQGCINVTCKHHWASTSVARFDWSEVWFFNALHKCDALFSWFFRHASVCIFHNRVIPHLLFFIFSWEKGVKSLVTSWWGSSTMKVSVLPWSDWGNNPAPKQASVYFLFSSLQMRTDLFFADRG